jgi:hypothetical protein
MMVAGTNSPAVTLMAVELRGVLRACGVASMLFEAHQRYWCWP